MNAGRRRVTIAHPHGELVLEPEDVEAIRSAVTVLEGEIVAVRLGGEMRARPFEPQGRGAVVSKTTASRAPAGPC